MRMGASCVDVPYEPLSLSTVSSKEESTWSGESMRLIKYNFEQTASVEPCSKNNETPVLLKVMLRSCSFVLMTVNRRRLSELMTVVTFSF